MQIFDRIKKSARVLLNGETLANKRVAIPAISADEVADARQFFQREKFFILGHARSGTTLLARLIRLHPEVHCNWQAHFFTREPFLKSLVDSPEAAEWLTRKSNRWNHGHDLSPLVLRTFADFILERDAASEGKRIVGDKSPSSLIHGQAVRDMVAIYPDAALIYIVRDGRDVLISERFRNFVEDSKFLTAEDKRIIAALKVDQAPFTDGRRSIFTEAFIRRSAEGWVANLAETEAEGKRLYDKRFFALRYEDLLAAPFAEMQKLWQFLGVTGEPGLETAVKAELASNPDEEWQAKRNDSIASFLPKGKAGNWRNMFTQHDRENFKDIAGSMLIKWGYEKDLNW
jgi:LPS sulfotransferase NodH